MKNKQFYFQVKIIKVVNSLLFLCLMFLFHYTQSQNLKSGNYKEVKHDIQLLHPGLDYKEKQKKTLIEIQDESGKAFQFYMDVESVICDDHRCKIEKVRLFWDKYGFYTKYELPKGVILEKTEGKPFSADDYKKLQTILLDLHSPIRYYYRDKIIEVGHGSSEGVDAVSGATTLVDKNAIVEGAAWTTVTLWHWANGRVFPIIRKITASHYTNQELLIGFENDTNKYKILAIKELTATKVYDDKTVTVVLSQAKVAANLTKVVISYIENAPIKLFFESFKTLYPTAEKEERILFLNSLYTKKEKANADFYDWLSTQLTHNKTYQELQLLLRILESKNGVNVRVVSEAFPLLDDPQWLIARSAYWFLQNKELTGAQKDTIENFRKKNSDKL